jgi:phospholipid/cholesterol/gamma-HCH transport system substrate-binding protein
MNSFERSCDPKGQGEPMVSAKVVGAGAFVIGGVLLFTVALFMIGERRMLFKERFPVYAEFARLGQLEVGAVVQVAGMDAGEVVEIHIPSSPEGKFRVKMEVREDLRQLIRTDSVATTQTEGLVGAIFLNIAAGTEEAPQVAEGGTILSREPFSMADLLQHASDTMMLVNQTVESLHGDIEKAVQQVALTTEEAHKLLTEVTPEIMAIAENGSRISADSQRIVARISAGEGAIGKFINDDSLYQRAREIAEEARVVTSNVRQVSDEARKAIADFRSGDGPAQGLFADMRLTLRQAREASGDLADNMEAMKHNFLLRGFFNRRGYYDLDAISPAQYQDGVLENGKRKAMRIWLGSNVLFEPGPGGTEVLSAEGRARVDSAMTTYLRYLPSNPIIVEGYATEGTVGERFSRSRQRAGVVYQYLLGRHELLPQHTGYIALGGDATGSPEGEQWDGVAITLFLDTGRVQFESQRSELAGAKQ